MQREPLEVVIENIQKVYELNNNMLEAHLENRGIQKSAYLNTFEQIFRKDACQTLNFQDVSFESVSVEEC